MNFILINFFKTIKLAESNWPPGEGDFLGPEWLGPFNFRCMECICILEPTQIKFQTKHGLKENFFYHCKNHWCRNYVNDINSLKEVSVLVVDGQTGKRISNPIIARNRILMAAEIPKKQNGAMPERTKCKECDDNE